jgi:hypothetical protein
MPVRVDVYVVAYLNIILVFGGIFSLCNWRVQPHHCSVGVIFGLIVIFSLQ